MNRSGWNIGLPIIILMKPSCGLGFPFSGLMLLPPIIASSMMIVAQKSRVCSIPERSLRGKRTRFRGSLPVATPTIANSIRLWVGSSLWRIRKGEIFLRGKWECSVLPGFAPAGEALLFRQKVPKPCAPHLASLERTDVNLKRADQLAEPVLSLVDGVKQGPPTKESVPSLGRTAGFGAGETTLSVAYMKER